MNDNKLPLTVQIDIFLWANDFQSATKQKKNRKNLSTRPKTLQPFEFARDFSHEFCSTIFFLFLLCFSTTLSVDAVDAVESSNNCVRFVNSNFVDCQAFTYMNKDMHTSVRSFGLMFWVKIYRAWKLRGCFSIWNVIVHNDTVALCSLFVHSVFFFLSFFFWFAVVRVTRLWDFFIFVYVNWMNVNFFGPTVCTV